MEQQSSEEESSSSSSSSSCFFREKKIGVEEKEESSRFSENYLKQYIDLLQVVELPESKENCHVLKPNFISSDLAAKIDPSFLRSFNEMAEKRPEKQVEFLLFLKGIFKNDHVNKFTDVTQKPMASSLQALTFNTQQSFNSSYDTNMMEEETKTLPEPELMMKRTSFLEDYGEEEEEDVRELKENEIIDGSSVELKAKGILCSEGSTNQGLSAADKKKFGKKLEKLEEILDEYIIKLEIKRDDIRQMCMGLLTSITPNIQVEFRNKPFEAVVASVLLVACSHLQYPITIKEVVNVASDSKGKTLTKMIHKCIFVVRGLLPKGEEYKASQPEELINKISCKLSPPSTTVEQKLRSEETAKKIIESMRRKNFIKGHHSSTVASYALLLSLFFLGVRITLKQVADAANINKITLKNLYRDLFPSRFEIMQDHDEFTQLVKQLPYT